jgi:poly-gamma-glutamate synthesis protein (capsule biosynthesis protein)
MKYILYVIVGIGAGVTAALLFLYLTNTEIETVPLSIPKIEEAVSSEPAISAYTASQKIVEDSFEAVLDWEVKDNTRVLLIPHHLVAGREIASLLSAVPNPKRVYFVAPDHFSQGRTSFTITDAAFDTIAGVVDNDVVRSQEIAESIEGATLNVRPFEREPGVSDLMPYFKTAWPEASVIPIIVRLETSNQERKDLTLELKKRLEDEPNAILVATVDFSHYLPAEVADFHDVLARDVIEGLGASSAFDVECDNPDVLSIALEVARNLLLGDVTIHAHTNSLKLAESKLATESTSHFTASFAEGLLWDQDEATMLFVGDMMFDRDVRQRMDASSDELFPFQNIVGTEGRFFSGQDYVVGNLEGPVTPNKRGPAKDNDFAFDPEIAALLNRVGINIISQANNHSLDQGKEGAEDSKRILHENGVTAVGDQVKDDTDSSLVRLMSRDGFAWTSLLTFNVTDNALDKDAALEAIKEAKRSSTYTVVFIHWGNEYQAKPSRAQEELARWFIDMDVDAVIGTHPHWMQSIESYRGRPIVYSLGNFVFDQDWSKETQLGLMVGLALSKDGSELHLFPISITESQPELLTGEERQARLNYLAEISDSTLDKHIKNGIVPFKP